MRYNFSAPELARIEVETRESLLEWADWNQSQSEAMRNTNPESATWKIHSERAAYLRKMAEEPRSPRPLLPLNGTKTHPLTAHSYNALERMTSSPIPRPEINAGVSNRLEREALGEWVDIPNPYPTSRKKQPLILHLQITEAGRLALANRPKR